MTAITIADPAARAHVAALSNAVDFEASKARVAAGALSDAERRRRELRTLLGDHDAAEPSGEADVADELSARLAANPSAASDTAWASALDQSGADVAGRHAAWKAKRSVIERSIATVDAEMPMLQRKQDAARTEHERAWAAFVWGAHGALMAEFEREFSEMRDRLLLPIFALEHARSLYGGGQLGYAGARCLHSGSILGVLVRPTSGSASGPAYEHLYPPRGSLPLDLIDRLREGLKDEKPFRR